MQLSLSHIAWPPDAEDQMLAFSSREGVPAIELAPLRAFGSPQQAKREEVEVIAERYSQHRLCISSFQALLFGAEGVELFGPVDARERMKQWLIGVGRVAGWCGAGPMVFGSPRNRLKGELSHSQALDSAIPFFREVGDACAEAGSCLVMEANPEAYGADFCTSLEQAAELVEAVDSPGFRLHLDAGGLALSGEDFVPVVRQAASLIAHAHASQPNLIDWQEPHPVHATMAAVLREINYQGAIAIEMRMQDDVLGSVRTAIEKVKQIYMTV